MRFPHRVRASCLGPASKETPNSRGDALSLAETQLTRTLREGRTSCGQGAAVLIPVCLPAALSALSARFPRDSPQEPAAQGESKCIR
jgi:hypothetical protein